MIPTKEELYAALEERHGAELQRRFSEAGVAVCGLGGLGSNIAISLARAGIGKLHLIDFDRVDISNLNRQQYAVNQLGMLKTEALRKTLEAVSPYCMITTDTVKLSPENIPHLLKGEDIICEAFDKADQKAMLVNSVMECFPEKYLVSGSGMSGLHSSNTIRTRKITGRFILCGDGESDVEKDGTLYAPRVMCCAAHQANAVLHIISGKIDEL